MKSPFPGMDPYLEAPDLWRGVHLQLINDIAAYLQPRLVPRYVARMDERVLLGSIREPFIPDVSVVESRSLPRTGATTAILADPSRHTQPEMIEVPELRYPHRYIEIRRAREGNLVSVIEVLSPGNKTAKGRDEYQEKQREYLLNEINLVEIDLLRRGQHTVAIPPDRTGPSDYRICVLPGGSHRFRLYRFSIRDRLPAIAIPLQDEDPDVTLDLQPVLERVYTEGAYPYVIDYEAEPDPRLSPEDAEWARERIAAWRSEQATSGR